MPEPPTARTRTAPSRSDVLAVLRAQRSDLERWGVRRAALFGSVARGEAQRGSDVDLLVELDPEAHIGLVRFVELKHRLAELLGYEVDLVSRGGIRSDRDAEILEQAVWAF